MKTADLDEPVRFRMGVASAQAASEYALQVAARLCEEHARNHRAHYETVSSLLPDKEGEVPTAEALDTAARAIRALIPPARHTDPGIVFAVELDGFAEACIWQSLEDALASVECLLDEDEAKVTISVQRMSADEFAELPEFNGY